jgi:hypothetical protein
MKRLALLTVLVLASCAKREDQQVTPSPAEPVAPTVQAIENGPASKFKGMPVQKPTHVPVKDPTPAASSAAPSAK